MLTTLSNGVSRLFANSESKLSFDHQQKHQASLDTDVLKSNIERAEQTLRSAEEKYGKLSSKQRIKRDVVTTTPSIIENRVNQTYLNIVEALANNTSNQTLSSLNVEGLSEEELKEDNYNYMLFKRSFEEHNLNATKLLIAKGANTNARSVPYGNSILDSAAYNCDLEAIKYLVDGVGMSVNLTNKDGRTPVHYSAKSAECTTFFINKGADIDVQDKDGYTPLHFAIIYSSTDAFKVLVNAGADVNKVTDECLLLPLIEMIKKGDEENVKLLLDKGARPNKESNSRTPMSIALWDVNNIKIVKLLIQYDAKVHDYYLAGAIDKDNKELINLLLNSDISFKIYTKSGSLCAAIEKNNISLIKSLLEKGASVNGKNCSIEDRDIGGCCSAAHQAAVLGNLDIMKLVVEAGAYIDSVCNPENTIGFVAHYTPLRLAVRYGHVEIVKFLLDKGVDVNAVNKRIFGFRAGVYESDNVLALDEAIYNHKDGRDREEIIKLLIKAGAKSIAQQPGSILFYKEYIPDFLTKTDEPGVFKIVENTVSTTPSTNVTDLQVSNSSSVTVSR